MKMPFGPHKGTDVRLLPEQYIIDLHQWPQLAGALKRCIAEEITRRRLSVASRNAVVDPDYQPPSDISPYDLVLCNIRDQRSQMIDGD
jgi:hypothetical protein